MCESFISDVQVFLLYFLFDDTKKKQQLQFDFLSFMLNRKYEHKLSDLYEFIPSYPINEDIKLKLYAISFMGIDILSPEVVIVGDYIESCVRWNQLLFVIEQNGMEKREWKNTHPNP